MLMVAPKHWMNIANTIQNTAGYDVAWRKNSLKPNGSVIVDDITYRYSVYFCSTYHALVDSSSALARLFVDLFVASSFRWLFRWYSHIREKIPSTLAYCWELAGQRSYSKCSQYFAIQSSHCHNFVDRCHRHLHCYHPNRRDRRCWLSPNIGYYHWNRCWSKNFVDRAETLPFRICSTISFPTINSCAHNGWSKLWNVLCCDRCTVRSNRFEGNFCTDKSKDFVPWYRNESMAVPGNEKKKGCVMEAIFEGGYNSKYLSLM